ncbi:alpha-1,3-mannosyl-glycoprotein 4-beta-N-acetylglucosaminyltransferase C-like [Rhinophrynus dorsalis]
MVMGGEPYERRPQNFSVKRDALDMLDIPYYYLLGAPPRQKRFLSIGISSVKRKRENYLFTTIKSIFDHSSREELEDLVVVVFLANPGIRLNADTARELRANFDSDITAGRLVVISVSARNYPPLDGLKRNFNDAPDRVKFRSKQNVDYAFLVNFCANLSQYYLMLEDDVTCSKNFLTSIKDNLKYQPPSWTTITFSSLGYIGKLYHSVDLPKLARFLLLFYDEMPCDWLLDLFFKSKAQKDIIRVKPSLFQHIGLYSSFQNSYNKLKDADFVEVVEKFGDIPPASCYTNIQVHLQNDADYACVPGPRYFWGKDVNRDSYFTMVFHEPVNIKKMWIITGSFDHPSDVLKSGYAELGQRKFVENNKKSCKEFKKIGDFVNGTFLVDNMDRAAGEMIDCVRIRISASQEEWLIIQKMGIWVRKEEIWSENKLL